MTNNRNDFFHRTGKTVKLIVLEDVGKAPSSMEKTYSKEAILSGDSSILNLDKEHSKIYVGGLPATFMAHRDIVDMSLEGRVEDLMLGNTFVGLWNFVDSSGKNNGSEERYLKNNNNVFHRCTWRKSIKSHCAIHFRNKFTNSPSVSGYRLNGEGFVVLESSAYEMSSRSSILLSIKTTSWDGLIFLAYKDNTFMSIELEGGSIVFKVTILIIQQ